MAHGGPMIPFRPIPIYGNRAPPHVSVQLPVDDSSSFGAKSRQDAMVLNKQLNLISQMNRLRTLGEYQLLHSSQFGNSSPAHILTGINKFSVKNLTAIGTGIETSHAIVHKKSPNAGQQKPYGFNNIPPTKPRCVGLAAPPTAPTSEPQRSSVDNSTVPVIIACGSPFSSQYGYGRKVFPCPQCRYTTDRRNNLKRHMLTMHQTCSKTLECCGIVFPTKASLREHAMIFHYHGYTCFYCGRRFCRKALLKRHLSVHNGQKDFVCPVCDYATSHKSNLERHRKVHCRPEEHGNMEHGKMEGIMDVSEGETSSRPSTFSWRSSEGHEGQIDTDIDDNNNTNVVMSSDDEDEEINVESD